MISVGDFLNLLGDVGWSVGDVYTRPDFAHSHPHWLVSAPLFKLNSDLKYGGVQEGPAGSKTTQKRWRLKFSVIKETIYVIIYFSLDKYSFAPYSYVYHYQN